jgi:hypothetical protein
MLVLVYQSDVVLDRGPPWGLQRLRSGISDEQQYSLPAAIRGTPTIASIIEDLPHPEDPIKAIEVR